MIETIIGNIQDFGGELIGVLGIIVALATYWKTRRRVGAAYYISTDHLIGSMRPRFPELEILYQGQKIQSFSSSKIFLWNGGTEAIRREDIAPAAPIAIHLRSPERALGYRVLYCSSPHSKIDIEPRDEHLLMGFDFLDPKDGVVIEILHTGGTGNVSVSGSVIGGGEISRREDLSLRKQYFLPVLFTAIFVLCYSGFALALARLSDVLFGEPSPWFIVPLFLMPAFLMPQVLPKLDALWSGGFMVKKLRDGYAKQKEALSVGKPPYTAVVDGEVKMGSIPTYSLALEHFGELCREYPSRKVQVFDQGGVTVCFSETRSL